MRSKTCSSCVRAEATLTTEHKLLCITDRSFAISICRKTSMSLRLRTLRTEAQGLALHDCDCSIPIGRNEIKSAQDHLSRSRRGGCRQARSHLRARRIVCRSQRSERIQSSVPITDRCSCSMRERTLICGSSIRKKSADNKVLRFSRRSGLVLAL